MKRLLFYSSVCLLMILFYGCTHQGDGKLPKVTTGNIALTYPFFDGTKEYWVSGFIEAKGAVVLTYGICYSMSDKKPDINGHHIDATRLCSVAFNESSPIRQGNQKQSIVVPFVEDPEYDELMWENWNVIYVRAYATTADGTVVYGKTETYHPGDCRTPESWDLLTRPNGWQLVNIIDVDHGSSVEKFELGAFQFYTGDILFFNQNGSLSYINENYPDWHGYVDYGWSYNFDEIEYDFFRNGTSESFYPDYDTHFHLANAHTSLEIATNELRINGQGQCFGGDNGNYFEKFEMIFTPVP